MTRACPACKQPLRDMTCTACARTYPAPSGIPVLLTAHERHLADSFVDALQHGRHAGARAERFRGAGNGDRAVAEAGSRQFFDDVVSALAPVVEPRALGAIVLDGRNLASPAYGDALPYVLRDWAYTETSEAELGVIDDRARALLPDGPLGCALVLGAGAGRTAWNLRDRFAEVVAIDMSFAMAYAFGRIHHGGLTLWENHLRTDSVPTFTRYALAPRAPTRPPAGAFEFWVATAADLPVADHSVDVVCCFYFLDVIRISTLAAEIRRVLRPGGRIINIGPLAYHHDEVLEHLDPAHVRALLRSFDLIVDPESEGWMRAGHLQLGPHMLRAIDHTVWSFRADFVPRQINSTTILRPRAPIEVRIARTDGGETITLVTPGHWLEVEMLQADAVELLDGRRSVAACIDVLATSYEIDDGVRAQILVELDRLRTIGMLEQVD